MFAAVGECPKMGYCRMGEEDDGESRDLPADERLAYVVRKNGGLINGECRRDQGRGLNMSSLMSVVQFPP